MHAPWRRLQDIVTVDKHGFVIATGSVPSRHTVPLATGRALSKSWLRREPIHWKRLPILASTQRSCIHEPEIQTREVPLVVRQLP